MPFIAGVMRCVVSNSYYEGNVNYNIKHDGYVGVIEVNKKYTNVTNCPCSLNKRQNMPYGMVIGNDTIIYRISVILACLFP